MSDLQTAALAASGYPCLVADIGGTNARFGLVAGPGCAVEHIAKLPASEHAGPTQAAQAYLAGVASGQGSAFQPPRRAAFAVATVVGGERIELTNSHWDFAPREVETELGLDLLLMLNDFEALALSLPRLQAAQLRAHGDLPNQRGTMAVIGPGTGLGVAGVTQTAHGWVALPGEGGHATLAAADAFEADLLAWVRRDYAHVSAERLLSGIGLPLLYRAVAAVTGVPDLGLPAEQVVERGVAGTDPTCVRALKVFCALLGGFAGNVALTLGARGGIYIGGGIVPRLGELFFESQFRERFEAKGRFEPYLANIPTALITDTLAALSGATLAIEQHGA
ncbi:glucokinase [Ideonella sp.]|uniref:glucokinase n=1 Tax=Ideonella sp. TaxID=1929293 RepID=UPI003BB64FA2